MSLTSAALQHPRPSSPPSPRWALASLSLTMLLSSLGTSIANVALPTFVQVFDTSFQAMQWVVLAYLLAVTIFIVIVGRLGDMVGRRRLMLAGIACFTVASIACGVASGLGVLIAARAIQGLGAAVMMALTMAMVGDAVPPERTGSAMGFLGTMSAVGTALGPSLGGVLIAALGWHSLFFLNVPLGLVALLLARRHLPVDRAPTSRPAFDYVGCILLALTLTAYALSMTLGRGRFGVVNGALLGIALAGAAVFLMVESRTRSPLVRPVLFRDRAISAGFVMSSLVTTVAMTTLVIGPFYLTGALRLSPAAVGLVMTSGPVVAALVGVPAGRSVDRFGARRVTIAGLACMATGCVALGLAPVSFGIAGYVLPLVGVTAGFAVFQAANNTAVLSGIAPGQRGIVSGLLNLSRNLGLITGASLMGAVFALASGTTDIANAGVRAVASGAHAAFAVAATLVIGALIIALGFSRPSQNISRSPRACFCPGLLPQRVPRDGA